MSGSYYYFGASLPSVLFDSKAPLSLDDFLDNCRRLMARGHYETIQAVLAGGTPETSSRTVQACLEFEHILKNELAFHQAHKAGKSPDGYVRGNRSFQTGVKLAIDAAKSAKNPLEAEKAIDRSRWEFYETMQIGHHYDFEYILLYGLKLKILERYHHVHHTLVGQERYKSLKTIDDLIQTLL